MPDGSEHIITADEAAKAWSLPAELAAPSLWEPNAPKPTQQSIDYEEVSE